MGQAAVRSKAAEFEDITCPECIDPYIVGDWVIDHRALIARALRRDEAIESPTYEVAVAIGQVAENPCDHPGWDDRGFAALATLGKAVK